MTWVVWRQQRSIVAAFFTLAVVFSIWLIVTGQHQQSLWNQFLAAPCKGHLGSNNGGVNSCDSQLIAIANGAHLDDATTIVGTILAPLLGLILGVNAVARELEQKTNRLAWTQSGTRSKWLASKYLASIATIVVISVPLCLVLSWWVRAAHDGARISPKVFPVSGFVEIAYGVLCFVLTVVVGLVIRRAGWTLAICMLIFAGLFFSFADRVRQHLVTPSVTTLQSSQSEEGSSSGFYAAGGAPANSWFFYQGFEPVSAKGVPSLGYLDTSNNAMNRCEINNGRLPGNYCLHHLHLRSVEVYISDNQFWKLQLLEGGTYVGAAALLAGLTFVGIRGARA